MGTVDLLLISVALGMDAFAVAIGKGLAMQTFALKKAVIVALYMGFFQFIMPVIGFYLGSNFESLITHIDHWIVFVLLTLISMNMLKESFSNDEHDDNQRVDFKTMIPLAIAASIDALASGILFSILRVSIWIPAIIIGVITFVMSSVGVKIGSVVGNKYRNRAESIGGVILFIIGLKILMEHLF